MASLINFVANIVAAARQLNLPPDTFAGASAAIAWLNAYAARQDARKVLHAALTVLQKQAPDTEKQLRAAKQLKGTTNVPAEVLGLLELTGSGDPSRLRAAQAPALRATVS